MQWRYEHAYIPVTLSLAVIDGTFFFFCPPSFCKEWGSALATALGFAPITLYFCASHT